jgi:D-glycero-D-manno-heptose 1,7-bisphosphate phosphatase
MPRSLAQKKYAAFCLGLRWAGNEGDMASDASTLKAVLFDRDGTLVVDVPYNGNAELVRPFPGARKVLDEVRGLGLATGVLSNQSGIARGLLTAEDVDRVNARVEDLLGPFDVWEVCPHGTGDGCVCRKPAPGMIHSACRRLGIDPSEVAFIGDIGSDVQAAAAAGARGVLVPTPQTRAEEVEAAPEVAADLEQAVALLLQGPLLRGPA